MKCCQTTLGSAYCGPLCASQRDADLRLKAEAAGEFLTFLISPEHSNTESPPPGPERATWMGAVKALFWTAAAVAVGIALAMVCN